MKLLIAFTLFIYFSISVMSGVVVKSRDDISIRSSGYVVAITNSIVTFSGENLLCQTNAFYDIKCEIRLTKEDIDKIIYSQLNAKLKN